MTTTHLHELNSICPRCKEAKVIAVGEVGCDERRAVLAEMNRRIDVVAGRAKEQAYARWLDFAAKPTEDSEL